MTANVSQILRRAHRSFKNAKLFCAVVLLPTILGVIYCGFIAPDIFVSESHFLVRNQSHQSVSGIGTLLQSTGISPTGDTEVYSVQDYLTSRDVLASLEKTYHLNATLSHAKIPGLDRLTTFSKDRTFEELLLYYQKHIVETDFDTTSSILTLIVRADSADVAFHINESLIKLSEGFVDKMNERSREDLLKFSIADVADAEQQALKASRAVSSYRNGESVFDPDKQAAIQLEQVSRLRQDLIATQSELADVKSVAPGNPQIPVLKNRLAVLQNAIAVETAKVAGGQGSLSTKSADYDGIVVYRDFAIKRLELAQASLQSARENALKQQIYVELVAAPNAPDQAMEPKRIRNILLVFVVSLMLYGLLSLINGAVRDHVT